MRLSEIKLKLNSNSFVYAQILFVLFMLWFRDVLHFPSAITYITDALLLLIIFQIFYRKNQIKILKDLVPQYIIVGLIVLFMLFGAIINLVKPLLVLWGLRNNLRFFAFFFICVNLLEISDVEKLIGIFKKFFWANLIMCLIQYYFFGLKNDYLGGFFGITQGCNGYLNVFICIMCAVAVADFISSKTNILSFASYILAALYIAVLAELKVFYFEIVMIIIFAVISNKPSLKTVLVSFISVVGIIVGVIVLFFYDSNSFAVLFDVDILSYYISGEGYTNSGDLNRFSAIEQIFTQFFNGSPLSTLFGLGLGNCEYSQFSFLQSDFSLQYGYLNYRWFTHAWVFIEQGAVGLTLLVSFFVSLFIYAVKRMRTNNRYYMILTVAFLPTCLLGLLYNTAIQVECCYIIAFVCAVSFIANKNDSRNFGAE